MTNDLYYTGWHAILWNTKIKRNVAYLIFCPVFEFLQASDQRRFIIDIILYYV